MGTNDKVSYRHQRGNGKADGEGFALTVLTISTDYDGDVNNVFAKTTNGTSVRVGVASKAPYHAFVRFPLTSLPTGATVSQVRLLVNCGTAGAAAHLLDIHPYNSDGQADPSADAGDPCYSRCAAGTAYINDDTSLRSTGAKAFTLGGTVVADVGNAKTAVNRFSLGLHEEGDNDNAASVTALDNGSNIPQLEITYTVPTSGGLLAQVL